MTPFTTLIPSKLASTDRESIDLWRVHLPNELCSNWKEFLSEDEIARAQTFSREEPLRRFALRRIALRRILAKYENISPNSLLFEYSNFGKPKLCSTSGLSFNTSSSEDFFLVAVGYSIEIGVDVETLRDIPDLEGVIKHSCSAAENDALALISDQGEKARVFFKLWTAKESILKMEGCGLSQEPATVCVAPLATLKPIPLLKYRDVSTFIFETTESLIALSTRSISPTIQFLIYSDRDLFNPRINGDLI